MPLPGMPAPQGSPPPGLPGAPGGALPLGLAPQSANMGGPSSPQGNPGLAAQAMLKARTVIKQLEELLPSVPIESPLHDKILRAVKDLISAMPDDNPDMAGPQSAMLLNVLRQAAQSAPLQMLARGMGGQQPGGGGGGMPMPMPSPGGGGMPIPGGAA